MGAVGPELRAGVLLEVGGVVVGRKKAPGAGDMGGGRVL